MNNGYYKKSIQKILDLIDVKINGTRDSDIIVHNPKFYQKVLSGGSLALGETYMAGWWDCKSLDKLFTKILISELDTKVKGLKNIIWPVIKAKVINLQTGSRSYKVGKQHYDIGNKLYENMLDKRLTYTCGYWKNAKNLDEAQEAKLDLICKKLKLKKGMRVLDIGCGWGSFAKYAAEKYKVSVVGVTISKEQAKLAKQLCKGLPVTIKLQDYRLINEKFDRVLSIGMFEHVGYKNYKTYFKVVNKCLKEDGISLLHTIAGNESVQLTDPWISKYIFPNSMLPSAKQITTAMEGLFVLEDWQNLNVNYDKTLLAWHNNFNKNWKIINKSNTYDDRFYRMWNYYLLMSAGSFRSRKNQLYQIVFSKKGILGGYTREC